MSNETNLAYRAAQLVRQRLGLTQGLTIELQKQVPMAAGLGGGSSNAAAVLLALQHWWQLPLLPEDLLEMAAALGSDVPFFLRGGLALCEGRGELITQLPSHWPQTMRWLLLLKPAISVSTATVFRNLTPSDYTNGNFSRQVHQSLTSRTALNRSNLHNSLERGVLTQYPEVEQARAALLSAGAEYVRLSGSGPTLFTSFAELASASQVQQRLQSLGYETYLTRPIDPAQHDITYF